MSKRPTVLPPILLVIATTLVCILPPQIQELLAHLLGKEIPQGGEWLPSWATWLLPLTAVAVLGGYATYLQWFDGRQYDAMFDRWNGLAHTHGFEPMAEIVLYGLTPQHQKVVRVARERGSFVLSADDPHLDFNDNIDRHFEGLSPWIREDGNRIFVHPDLLRVRPA